MASSASQLSLKCFFQDPEYKNWQKAGLCFYKVKEVLEPCVEDVSKTIHKELTSLSKPCNCIQNALCKNCEEKWKGKIQDYAVGKHGTIDIDWKNKDIVRQPAKYWSVAKCFVEHDLTDKYTAFACDISPLLTFIVNCNKFTEFGNIQDSARKVRRDRNEYIHGGQPKVSNTTLQNYKRNMVNLLKNMKLKATGKAEEAQNFIEKVCDVNYSILLEDEVKATFSELQGQLDSVLSRFHTINPQLQSAKQEVSDLQNDIRDLEEEKAKDQSNLDKLNKMYENLREKIDKEGVGLKEFVKRVTTLEGRVDKLEDQHSSLRKAVDDLVEKDKMSLEEDSRNRIPETDGLKKLKYQTKNKLDTLRRLQFIPTKQAEEAKELLQKRKTVVIKGNPGEGKTTIALHLIDNEMYRDRCVVLYYPRHWEEVDTERVNIIMLEDVFGRFDLDTGRLQDWMVYLPTIQEHVDAGKLQVIVTTRADILSKAYSQLGSLKLFSDDLSLTLSSEKLTNSEKLSILNRELRRHERNMEEDDKQVCITNLSGLIGFPQCCSLFAGDSKSFDRGPEFFKSPEKFFVENITALGATRFLSLAFLFCNGKIYEENLSPETMPESSKLILMELASHLHISEEEADIKLLRDAYDRYMDLYVAKSESLFELPYIQFTHSTVCEAVGHVLGDRSIEMVVKYGDSDYLYQRTYTAEAKDGTSQNVFIPESIYELLVERMVHDVKRGLVGNVVKHSALKQYRFLMKLKCELYKVGDLTQHNFFTMLPKHHEDIFMNMSYFLSLSDRSYLSKGKCNTFMQYILQSDDDVVRLVYSEFLEFFKCAHNQNSSDCWQCDEKQKLLELALYYHHFQIADRLIAMNACYTHASLCNAARHGDLRRVQIILRTIRGNKCFNPECEEAETALFRAFISGNQSLIKFLLKEGIILRSYYVIDAVQHGDINVLMKVVEHLKSHDKWNPHQEEHQMTHSDYHKYLDKNSSIGCDIPYSTALYMTYYNEKFDMADYLLKNEVVVSQDMLADVSGYCSQKAVNRLIQNLKDVHNWYPMFDDASVALRNAYSKEKYDVCDRLVQEGVSLTMTNLPGVMCSLSFDCIKKLIQNLKDTDKWDPKCDVASHLLAEAYFQQKYDLCDLLVQEGVSLTMQNFCGMTQFPSLQCIEKVIHHLQDTDNWDPKCNDASHVLEDAYRLQQYNLCSLLVQEGVSLTMQNLHHVTDFQSLESVEKVIQHLKDTDNWDPKCDDAFKALTMVYFVHGQENYDVHDLLVEEGVLLTMRNFAVVTEFASLESVKKVIQHLKDTDNWDPKCDDASKVLENAYRHEKYDVFDLLVQEGVSLTMKNFSVLSDFATMEFVKKVIQHLKDTDNWDPKCEDASKVLENAYRHEKYDVFDLLVQEGVSLTMRNFLVVTEFASLESVKKVIQHLKDTNNWDPMCDDAAKLLQHAFFRHRKYGLCDLLVLEGCPLPKDHLAYMTLSLSFESVKKLIQDLKNTDNQNPKYDDAVGILKNAYRHEKYDLCDLLVQEGVSLTMKDFPDMTMLTALECVKKVIQHLKDTHSWIAVCDDASKALENAYVYHQYDVCDLLIQEGVSLKMKDLPGVAYLHSDESVKEAIEHLKDTDNWNPRCDDAYKVLQNALRLKQYKLCDVLVQEGVTLPMKDFYHMALFLSLESVKKVIQYLKDTDSWNPKCDDASRVLENAYRHHKYDLCYLLAQEGVSLTMKDLPSVIYLTSLEPIMKVIQHLKDTNNWNPKCDDASKVLENAFRNEQYDVCDWLVQEGISLTMRNFLVVTEFASLESIKKVIQHLKDTNNWDPMCDDASKILKKAYRHEKYDMCDLLIHEGISLTMKNVRIVTKFTSLEPVIKIIQHLKESDNWDPKCHNAASVLGVAYFLQKYDVCDLLIQEGVSLPMKKFPHLIVFLSFGSVKKALRHLKDTDNWNPKCDDASELLEIAYIHHKYDVIDLLVQEGVSVSMKDLHDMAFFLSVESVKKVIQHLKDTDSWDPKCEDASKVLENAYRHEKYNVCDLLVQEGVTLTMNNLPGLTHSAPVESVKKVIQHLKDTDNWNPKCDDASKVLEIVYILCKYDVYDLLVQEGVLLTMRNLHSMIIFLSLEAVQKVIQHLKDTNSWNPKCDDASQVLENAYLLRKYDVCDLVLHEGVPLTMGLLGLMCKLSSECIEKKIIQDLKDTENWDPNCGNASDALENAYKHQKYDVCDLLVQEGVFLTMKNLPRVTYFASLESATNIIKHIKDTENWDPNCDDASESLENAYKHQKYDVCDLLVQEGVSLTMKNLPGVTYFASLESVQKVIQHLKDTDNWDPKCDDASQALENAFQHEKYDVCDWLVQEGASLTMKNLSGLMCRLSFECIEKATQHLQDADNWDPKCDDASKLLEQAYKHEKYDACDLLVQVGVSLTMRNLPGVMCRLSFECIQKVIQHLQDTDNWDPKCDDASKVLENAYRHEKYDVCDLLVQVGVSLKMKNLPGVMCSLSFECIQKVIQHLKDTDNWDSKCNDASKVLGKSFLCQKYDVCYLLIQEGVSLTMKDLPGVLGGFNVLLKAVKKVIRYLKHNDSWDPKCDDASKALENAYRHQKYDVCDLLVHEGVSLTMKNLPGVTYFASLESVQKVIQHLKDTDNWDPKCDDASQALAVAYNAYNQEKYDVQDLLVQEGVTLMSTQTELN